MDGDLAFKTDLVDSTRIITFLELNKKHKKINKLRDIYLLNC